MTIYFQDVTVVRRGRKILTDISCEIPTGKFVSIVGPNGAGKTTFLRCLSGIEKLNSGTITGVPGGPSDRQVAYVPEDLAMPFSFTVMDVVLMGRFSKHCGTPTTEDREIAFRCIQEVGLGGFDHRQYPTLSTGEKRKTMLARALASERRILLLDELIANLDVHAQLEILELLKNFVRQSGRTVMMSIHDLALARNATNHIVILKEGTLVASGVPEETLSPNVIKKVFGVNTEISLGQKGKPLLTFFL